MVRSLRLKIRIWAHSSHCTLCIYYLRITLTSSSYQSSAYCYKLEKNQSQYQFSTFDECTPFGRGRCSSTVCRSCTCRCLARTPLPDRRPHRPSARRWASSTDTASPYRGSTRRPVARHSFACGCFGSRSLCPDSLRHRYSGDRRR